MMDTKTIIVGDVGGTNTNLAVAQLRGSEIEILERTTSPSHDVVDFSETLSQFFSKSSVLSNSTLGGICISGAGPVIQNCIKLTNQNWVIDGLTIEKKMKVPTLIINDFSAVSYSLPLLDPSDPKIIQCIPKLDGSTPSPQNGLKLALGPGTGLGVGILVPQGEKWQAFPSEGGHVDFAPWDKETEDIAHFLRDQIGTHPGCEPLVSGIGINNLFLYYFHKLESPTSKQKELMEINPLLRPQKISEWAENDEFCTKIMEVFVKILARFTSNYAAALMPKGGIYIAGGIAAKNFSFLTKNKLFSQFFEKNYNPHIVEILKEIPVYVVMDYSISLKGAANAARFLLDLGNE